MIDSLLEINSPQSLIVNIILLLGIYNFGKITCEKKILKNVNLKEFHYSLFGLIFISISNYFFLHNLCINFNTWNTSINLHI